MAESSGVSKSLLGCGVLLVGGVVLCCGGGVLSTYFASDILLWMATSDQPIEVQATPYDEAKQLETRARLYKALDETGSTTITAEDLNVLVASPGDVRAHVSMAGEELTFDFSTRLEPDSEQYINVHVRTAFVMEGGWFTHLTISEARLSDWDLGPYVAGQELAMNANQSLAKQRAEDPEMDAIFAATELVAVREGRLEVKMDKAKLDAVIGSSPAMQAVDGGQEPIQAVPATD